MSSLPICVDASLVIRLVVDPTDVAVRQLWARWDAEERRIAAPTLLYYEVTNVLYRYRRAEMLSAEAMRLALRAALALPVRLYGEPALHDRALRLAERFLLPAAYDAHYLAVADWLGAELWTADRRLAASVQSDLLWVRTVDG